MKRPSLPKGFSWEQPPFETCPSCQTPGIFGRLSIDKDSVRKRCKRCRYSHNEILSALDKRVIYLDQFAFSELHKLRAGTRRPDKRTEFWTELSELVTQAVLLQQVVLPHSDIHHNETIVSPFPRELRDTQEHIGGDIRFTDTSDIQFRQVEDFAAAYVEGLAPIIDTNVDEILDGSRNAWLPEIRVSVRMDWSSFTGETRQNRQQSGESVSQLTDRWIAQGMGFDEVLAQELGAYHESRIEGLRAAQNRFEKGLVDNDVFAWLNFSQGFAMRELQLVRQLFSKTGVPDDELSAKVREFWSWPQNREQPFGKLLAYLFAALADQFANGRRKKPSAGFMGDVSAIAAYAPYVDAMLIDNECAELLRHKRCVAELDYRAHIFSLNRGGEFLEYLRGVIAATPDEVRHAASVLYGV